MLQPMRGRFRDDAKINCIARQKDSQASTMRTGVCGSTDRRSEFECAVTIALQMDYEKVGCGLPPHKYHRETTTGCSASHVPACKIFSSLQLSGPNLMPDDITGDGRADGALPSSRVELRICGWFFNVVEQQMRQ